MVIPIAGGLAALILLVLLIVPTIRYRVAKRRLVITALGVPVRWVSLKNIRYLTDHSKGVAESWPNCFSSIGRGLYVRKRRGLFRWLMITPDKRFVFKAEVEKAIHLLNPKAPFDETTFYERPTPKSQVIKSKDSR